MTFCIYWYSELVYVLFTVSFHSLSPLIYFDNFIQFLVKEGDSYCKANKSNRFIMYLKNEIAWFCVSEKIWRFKLIHRVLQDVVDIWRPPNLALKYQRGFLRGSPVSGSSVFPSQGQITVPISCSSPSHTPNCLQTQACKCPMPINAPTAEMLRKLNIKGHQF